MLLDALLASLLRDVLLHPEMLSISPLLPGSREFSGGQALRQYCPMFTGPGSTADPAEIFEFRKRGGNMPLKKRSRSENDSADIFAFVRFPSAAIVHPHLAYPHLH